MVGGVGLGVSDSVGLGDGVGMGDGSASEVQPAASSASITAAADATACPRRRAFTRPPRQIDPRAPPRQDRVKIYPDLHEFD